MPPSKKSGITLELRKRITYMAAADIVGEIIRIGFCIHSAVSSYWGVLGFVRPISPTIQSL